MLHELENSLSLSSLTELAFFLKFSSENLKMFLLSFIISHLISNCFIQM